MFDDGNPMLARAAAGRPPRQARFRLPLALWPGPIVDLAGAVREARPGLLPATWYLLSTGVGIVLAVSSALTSGRLRGVSPGFVALQIAPLGVVLAVLLAADTALYRRQSRWAALVLLAWTLWNLPTGWSSLARGVFNLSIVINLACLVAAIRCVRGALAVARLRRRSAQSAEVFS